MIEFVILIIKVALFVLGLYVAGYALLFLFGGTGMLIEKGIKGLRGTTLWEGFGLAFGFGSLLFLLLRHFGFQLF